MPIGIGTAVAGGAALLGAGATIYASNKASSAQTQAANQASDVSLAVANENNQLARDTYNANAERLDPYSRMGLAAGDEYTALLLGDAGSAHSHGYAPVGGTPAPGTGTIGATVGSTQPAYTGPSLTQILAMKDDGIPHNYENALAAYNAAQQPGAGSQPSALAPFASPVSVTQQAQQAIAAGADPTAVRARALQYGVRL
jgi:hypothetical protein